MITTEFKFLFEANRVLRKAMLDAVAHLSLEQLHVIPQGMSNNIIWNIGHVIASQQILCYKLGNAPLLVPENFVEKYRKGTSPKDWTSFENMDTIKQYMELTNAIEEQYNAGAFANFTEYKTSMGFALKTIEDGLIYNYGHENLHYGSILSLRKMV